MTAQIMDGRDATPLAERRERGMNDLAAVIQALYGDRCTRNEGGCTGCAVWAIYDALDKMTNSSVFDLADGGVTISQGAAGYAASKNQFERVNKE